MSKSNAFENDFLLLVFHGTPIANLADNAAVAPFTSLYVSLHTADPGEAGDQTSSEATYTGYARVAVTRDSTGWTVTGSQVVNAGVITFPNCTAGSNAMTFFGVGTNASGPGTLLYSGQLAPGKTISTSNTPPDFLAGQLIITED